MAPVRAPGRPAHRYPDTGSEVPGLGQGVERGQAGARGGPDDAATEREGDPRDPGRVVSRGQAAQQFGEGLLSLADDREVDGARGEEFRVHERRVNAPDDGGPAHGTDAAAKLHRSGEAGRGGRDADHVRPGLPDDPLDVLGAQAEGERVDDLALVPGGAHHAGQLNKGKGEPCVSGLDHRARLRRAREQDPQVLPPPQALIAPLPERPAQREG